MRNGAPGSRWLRVVQAIIFAALCGAGVTGAGIAGQATPIADTEDDPAGFLAMLDLVPDLLTAGEWSSVLLAEYANVAAQLATVGATAPRTLDEPAAERWLQAVWALALPSPAREHVTTPLWRETFGFDLLQIDQSLVTGDPPGRIFVLRGRFDPAELRAAWERSGYSPVDLPGAEAFSFAEDPEISVETDVGRLALNAFNNAALLPDGMLLFTSSLERLRLAVATATGAAPSLADRSEIAALVAILPPSLVSGYLASGEALRRLDPAEEVAQGRLVQDEANALATAIAQENAGLPPLPPIRLAALGLTAGGPLRQGLGGPPATLEPGMERARFALALRFDDPAAAGTAAAIVERRLETGVVPSTRQPWTELFAAWDVAVAPDDPILTIELVFADDTPVDVWSVLFLRRDLGFVGW